MPGVSGVTVVTMLVCFFTFAHKAAGAPSARHSLRPLIGRRFFQQTSRGLRGEIAESWLVVIARSNATKQSTSSPCGLMDCFACARNDALETTRSWLFEIRICGAQLFCSLPPCG